MIDAAYAPTGNRLALLRQNELLLLDATNLRGAVKRAFAGSGRFDTVTWSPDGHWLLVDWPNANQWVFVNATGTHRLKPFRISPGNSKAAISLSRVGAALAADQARVMSGPRTFTWRSKRPRASSTHNSP